MPRDRCLKRRNVNYDKAVTYRMSGGSRPNHKFDNEQKLGQRPVQSSQFIPCERMRT